MSLSELYRLPVSNLRLSAHASVPSSRKKSQQSLPKQNEFCGCYYASALFSISIAVGYLHNNWSPLGRAVFPCAPTACQKPVLFFCLLRKGFFLLVTWCCWIKTHENHTACLQPKTQLLVHLQNQLDQALTSSFLTCTELKWEQEIWTNAFWLAYVPTLFFYVMQVIMKSNYLKAKYEWVGYRQKTLIMPRTISIHIGTWIKVK